MRTIKTCVKLGGKKPGCGVHWECNSALAFHGGEVHGNRGGLRKGERVIINVPGLKGVRKVYGIRGKESTPN